MASGGFPALTFQLRMTELPGGIVRLLSVVQCAGLGEIWMYNNDHVVKIRRCMPRIKSFRKSFSQDVGTGVQVGVDDRSVSGTV